MIAARIIAIRNASSGQQKVPLEAISTIGCGMRTGRLQRRNQFRTITVSTSPAEGHLSSDVITAAMPQLRALEQSLPPGYRLEIGGEYEEQPKGFAGLAIAMLTSIALIFLALVVQFKHAVKPVIVFAAIPFGVVGALATLWLWGRRSASWRSAVGADVLRADWRPVAARRNARSRIT